MDDFIKEFDELLNRLGVNLTFSLHCISGWVGMEVCQCWRCYEWRNPASPKTAGGTKMDAITKESKEWRVALALVPEKYKDEMCTTPVKPVDDYEFGDVWCPSCNKVFGCGNHDREVPDILPNLLYAIRRAIEAKGHEWVLKYYQRDEIYTFRIYGSYGAYLEETGATEAEAIIRAAVSLQEAK